MATMSIEGLPDGWEVWDLAAGDRLILVFRPDRFDGDEFPPACLPTIYVREGEQDLSRVGPDPAPGTEATWAVTLFLEPGVSAPQGVSESWDEACELAVERAHAFVDGEIDIDGMYQRPRELYLEELHGLIGDDEA